MPIESPCLRCDATFDYDGGECPECGWNAAEFRERGRYGLSRSKTGDVEESSGGGGGVGPVH